MFFRLVIAFVVVLSLSQKANAAAFYFVAHQDDVELFMARTAFYDIMSGAKTIFVVTTAGAVVVDSYGNVIQSGMEPYPGLGPNPYYLARNTGHAAALRYWYSLQGRPVGVDIVTNVQIAGRSVQRTEIGGAGSNVIMYNMNLRDGLKPFRDASLTDPTVRISTIDGAQSFTWNELKTFVMALIQREQDMYETNVNTPEYDSQHFDDHLDHTETGRLVGHALQDYARSSPSRCIKSYQWVGYYMANHNWPLNYTAYEQSVQTNTWNVLNDAMVAAQGPDTRDAGHAQYLYRMYSSANGVNGLTKFGPCP